MKVRDRITEIRKVKAGDLRPNPKNWRMHPQAQQDAMRGVLAEVGMAGVPLVVPTDDGAFMLIDGHLRAEVLDPTQEISVAVLDVTESEAAYLLATHDPLAAMAEADSALLDALLRDFNSGNEAVQQMLAGLADGAGLYGDGKEAPEEFPEVNEDIETEHECPKCGYKWSGGE